MELLSERFGNNLLKDRMSKYFEQCDSNNLVKKTFTHPTPLGSEIQIIFSEAEFYYCYYYDVENSAYLVPIHTLSVTLINLQTEKDCI